MSATTTSNDKTSVQVSSTTSNLLEFSATTAGMSERATFTDPVEALKAFAVGQKDEYTKVKNGQLLSIEVKEGKWDSFSVVAYFIKEQEGDLIFQKLDGRKFGISPEDERTIMRIERANPHSSWNNNVHGISREALETRFQSGSVVTLEIGHRCKVDKTLGPVVFVRVDIEDDQAIVVTKSLEAPYRESSMPANDLVSISNDVRGSRCVGATLYQRADF